MRHVEPPIWREISVPDVFSLFQLHRCIQLVFGWLDYHLFEFQISDRRFEGADPEAEGENAASVRLRDLELNSRSSFLYLYDMGDYWEHDITVRGVRQSSRRR
ncbi:MAG: plasmid pRiA4b ORF-3 family protein [Gemmatimonadaceae bacterium]|nr:plasmid pRiA4b ORF-3 family protein [Gemmatimonadaceae bacterium]